MVHCWVEHLLRIGHDYKFILHKRLFIHISRNKHLVWSRSICLWLANQAFLWWAPQVNTNYLPVSFNTCALSMLRFLLPVKRIEDIIYKTSALKICSDTLEGFSQFRCPGSSILEPCSAIVSPSAEHPKLGPCAGKITKDKRNHSSGTTE